MKDEEESESEDSVNMARHVRQDNITNQRLRQKNVAQQQDNQARKKSQNELHAKKLEELKERFERGDIQGSVKKDKVKRMGDIQSYSNDK